MYWRLGKFGVECLACLLFGVLASLALDVFGMFGLGMSNVLACLACFGVLASLALDAFSMFGFGQFGVLACVACFGVLAGLAWNVWRVGSWAV